jgi:hypothetical protein
MFSIRRTIASIVLRTKPGTGLIGGSEAMLRGSASYRRRTANNKSARRFYTTDNIKHDIEPFATADVTLTGKNWIRSLILKLQ